MSDKLTSTNAYRSGKSALDEFLPELHVQRNHREGYLDPRDVQFEPEADRKTIVVDQSRVQWWPMFAAALVGIGVSLLAFGAWARFGQF